MTEGADAGEESAPRVEKEEAPAAPGDDTAPAPMEVDGVDDKALDSFAGGGGEGLGGAVTGGSGVPAEAPPPAAQEEESEVRRCRLNTSG